MTRAEFSAAIPTLSTADRLTLLDELWASLDHDDFAPEITAEVKTLLDERLAEDEASPDDVITWEEIKASLKAQP